MAIDYGLKRTGLAVSDPMQLIATPLETVETARLLVFLQEYVQKEEVECFVLGLPKGLDNLSTHATAPVLQFRDALRQKFGKPVYLLDERFTSSMAVQAMVAGGMKKKDRRDKANIDKVSATILLQDFMRRRE